MMRRKSERPARHALIAGLFLACAVLLGGGGSPSPATEILLQLAFVAAALAWLWVPSREGGPPVPASRTFWWVCALVLAVPVAQLIPLPSGVWQSLGGQQDRAAALALVGQGDSWRPLTRSPSRTLAALLAMIPALFAYFATAALDARGRWWVVGTIAALTLATALLGAVQISLDAPYFYPDNHRTLTGFQANRNAAADLLLIGLAAGAAFALPLLAGTGERSGPTASRGLAAIVFGGFAVLVSFAVILTASRTGIALLPLVLVGVWIVLRPALPGHGRRRLFVPLAALAAAPLVALAALASGNTALGTVAERFVFADDARREMWRDAAFATAQAWPFGVGMGGAQPAMIAAERLEVLAPTLPNRAHNDYLELALEGGLPALAVLALIGLLLARAAWRSWRDRPFDRHLTACGVIILLVTALHSFVDYPLRSMALACLVGTGAGLLMGIPRQKGAAEPSI